MHRSYRSRKVEKCVIDFYKALPENLRRFIFDIRKAVSTLENCVLISYQEFAERHNTGVAEVIAYCESDTGCTCKEQNKNKYIVMFNDSQYIPEESKAFTIAHELGHILIGHLTILESFKIFNSSDSNQHFEREANYFAASVLSPAPVLSCLDPKSALAVRNISGLSLRAAEIVFKDYLNYDKNYNTEWHNNILALFDLAKIMPEKTIHTRNAEIIIPAHLFERAELDWI